MKESEELYDKIERFISDEMDQQERAVFIALMESDAELKSEVELHKELKRNLSDSPLNDYINTLQSVEHKIIDDSNQESKNDNWKYLLAGLALVIGSVLVWFANSNNQKSGEQVEETIPNEIVPENNEQKIETTDSVNFIYAEETQEKDIIKNIEVPEMPLYASNDDASSVNDLTSTNFIPNKQLELLLGSSTRGTGIYTNVLNRQKDITLGKDSISTFSIQANIESDRKISSSDLTVYIFNNQESSYEDFLPILKFQPIITIAEDTIILDVTKRIFLTPGLYYYIIEESESEESIFVDRFKVNK